MRNNEKKGEELLIGALPNEFFSFYFDKRKFDERFEFLLFSRTLAKSKLENGKNSESNFFNNVSLRSSGICLFKFNGKNERIKERKQNVFTADCFSADAK